MERPSPVPSPAGLVVKNGLKILSFTSLECHAVVTNPDFQAFSKVPVEAEGWARSYHHLLAPLRLIAA